jgi:hypothetical protein
VRLENIAERFALALTRGAKLSVRLGGIDGLSADAPSNNSH